RAGGDGRVAAGRIARVEDVQRREACRIGHVHGRSDGADHAQGGRAGVAADVDDVGSAAGLNACDDAGWGRLHVDRLIATAREDVEGRQAGGRDAVIESRGCPTGRGIDGHTGLVGEVDELERVRPAVVDLIGLDAHDWANDDVDRLGPRGRVEDEGRGGN